MIGMKFEPAGVIDLLFEVEETSRPVGPMPCMDGVTDLFESTVGLTASVWENQIFGGDDITWTGMEIQEDGSAGVLGTSGSYGVFSSAYSEERTVYCLFKAPALSIVRQNRHIIGSCGGSVGQYRTGAWLTVSVDQYSAGDIITTDQWGIGASAFVSCYDYHVVAVTRDATGLNTIYADGVPKSTLQNHVACSDNWGVGLIVDEYGNLGESPSSLQQIHFIALANAAHSAEQVAENSAWIRQHFPGV